jgi:uncharacterized coiled-coil protein SlyX
MFFCFIPLWFMPFELFIIFITKPIITIVPFSSLVNLFSKQYTMENRIQALEEKQRELIEAINEVNTNIASIGYSTTESIKAIMEGFQNVTTAMQGIAQNFNALEERITEIEKKMNSNTFTTNN